VILDMVACDVLWTQCIAQGALVHIYIIDVRIGRGHSLRRVGSLCLTLVRFEHHVGVLLLDGLRQLFMLPS